MLSPEFPTHPSTVTPGCVSRHQNNAEMLETTPSLSFEPGNASLSSAVRGLGRETERGKKEAGGE